MAELGEHGAAYQGRRAWYDRRHAWPHGSRSRTAGAASAASAAGAATTPVAAAAVEASVLGGCLTSGVLADALGAAARG